MSLRLAGGSFGTDCVGCAVASSRQAGLLTLRSLALLSTYGGDGGEWDPTGLGSKSAGFGSITAMPGLRMEDPLWECRVLKWREAAYPPALLLEKV